MQSASMRERGSPASAAVAQRAVETRPTTAATPFGAGGGGSSARQPEAVQPEGAGYSAESGSRDHFEDDDEKQSTSLRSGWSVGGDTSLRAQAAVHVAPIADDAFGNSVSVGQELHSMETISSSGSSTAKGYVQAYRRSIVESQPIPLEPLARMSPPTLQAGTALSSTSSTTDTVRVQLAAVATLSPTLPPSPRSTSTSTAPTPQFERRRPSEPSISMKQLSPTDRVVDIAEISGLRSTTFPDANSAIVEMVGGGATVMTTPSPPLPGTASAALDDLHSMAGSEGAAMTLPVFTLSARPAEQQRPTTVGPDERKPTTPNSSSTNSATANAAAAASQHSERHAPPALRKTSAGSEARRSSGTTNASASAGSHGVRAGSGGRSVSFLLGSPLTAQQQQQQQQQQQPDVDPSALQSEQPPHDQPPLENTSPPEALSGASSFSGSPGSGLGVAPQVSSWIKHQAEAAQAGDLEPPISPELMSSSSIKSSVHNAPGSAKTLSPPSSSGPQLLSHEPREAQSPPLQVSQQQQVLQQPQPSVRVPSAGMLSSPGERSLDEGGGALMLRSTGVAVPLGGALLTTSDPARVREMIKQKRQHQQQQQQQRSSSGTNTTSSTTTTGSRSVDGSSSVPAFAKVVAAKPEALPAASAHRLSLDDDSGEGPKAALFTVLPTFASRESPAQSSRASRSTKSTSDNSSRSARVLNFSFVVAAASPQLGSVGQPAANTSLDPLKDSVSHELHGSANASSSCPTVSVSVGHTESHPRPPDSANASVSLASTSLMAIAWDTNRIFSSMMAHHSFSSATTVAVEQQQLRVAPIEVSANAEPVAPEVASAVHPQLAPHRPAGDAFAADASPRWGRHVAHALGSQPDEHTRSVSAELAAVAATLPALSVSSSTRSVTSFNIRQRLSVGGGAASLFEPPALLPLARALPPPGMPSTTPPSPHLAHAPALDALPVFIPQAALRASSIVGEPRRRSSSDGDVSLKGAPPSFLTSTLPPGAHPAAASAPFTVREASPSERIVVVAPARRASAAFTERDDSTSATAPKRQPALAGLEAMFAAPPSGSTVRMHARDEAIDADVFDVGRRSTIAPSLPTSPQARGGDRQSLTLSSSSDNAELSESLRKPSAASGVATSCPSVSSMTPSKGSS